MAVCFHKYLAGLRIDEEQPGFKNIIVRPLIPKGLNYVKGSIETVSGEASCEWKITEKKLEITVQIPFNCTADLYLPVIWEKGASVICNGQESFKEAFCDRVLPEGRFLYQRTGAGTWSFELKENGDENDENT